MGSYTILTKFLRTFCFWHQILQTTAQMVGSSLLSLKPKIQSNPQIEPVSTKLIQLTSQTRPRIAKPHKIKPNNKYNPNPQQNPLNAMFQCSNIQSLCIYKWE